jgi:hypothetical protein
LACFGAEHISTQIDSILHYVSVGTFLIILWLGVPAYKQGIQNAAVGWTMLQLRTIEVSGVHIGLDSGYSDELGVYSRLMPEWYIKSGHVCFHPYTV